MLLTIIIAVFLVAAVLLGVTYSGANSDHKQAQANLDAARASQAALTKEKTDLAAQLALAVADVASWNDKVALLQAELGQATLSLQQTQGKFPASAQTIEYNEMLMGLAKASNLTMRTVVATEPDFGNLSTSEFTFYTNVFTIEVSGKVSDILDFVDKVSTNATFKTGVLSPVAFSIPQPLSQVAKDQMRLDLRNAMIAQVDASVTGTDRILLIEESFLTLFRGQVNEKTITEMTKSINDIIVSTFGQDVATLLSNEIALAIQNNLADTLIDTVATIYTEAMSALFLDTNTPGLLPTFSGFVGSSGPDSIDTLITEAIQGIPTDTIPGVIKKIITDKLNSLVAAKITRMVSDASVDAELLASVTAAEMPSAQLTIAVNSYKGD